MKSLRLFLIRIKAITWFVLLFPIIANLFTAFYAASWYYGFGYDDDMNPYRNLTGLCLAFGILLFLNAAMARACLWTYVLIFSLILISILNFVIEKNNIIFVGEAYLYMAISVIALSITAINAFVYGIQRRRRNMLSGGQKKSYSDCSPDNCNRNSNGNGIISDRAVKKRYKRN